MKTTSERGKERPAQDNINTKENISIGMKVTVQNQTSYFTKYNSKVGVVEDIGLCPEVGTHGNVLFSVRLPTQQILLLYRDEVVKC